MLRQVDVVDTYNDTIENVAVRAESHFQTQLAEYRRLVTKMADGGGTLPQDEADALIRICDALGVPPERLAEDSTAIATAKTLERDIAAVHARNAERRAPLPELQQRMIAAQRRYSAVRDEWDTKLKAAERESTEARREYEKLLNARMEPTDHLDRRLRDTHEWVPHLFGPITRESLKRVLDPNRSRTIR
jgi:hypothetical protein